MINKTIFNPLKLDGLFNPLSKLCTKEGIAECKTQFKSKYITKREQNEFIEFSYQEKTETFNFFEQTGDDEFVKKSISFKEFFKEKLNQIVIKIKNECNVFVSQSFTIDETVLHNFIDYFEKRINALKVIVLNLSDENGSDEILNQCLAELKIDKSKLQKGFNSSIKKKEVINNARNYFKSHYFQENVVEELHCALLKKEYIEKCTAYQFGHFFREQKKTNKDTTTFKLNWKMEIGLFRYFINQLEFEFNIKEINSTKWKIAENCFLWKSKAYKFSEEGSNGKYSTENNRIIIQQILSNAKSLYQNSGS